MTKFELKADTREIRYKERFEIRKGCVLNQDLQEPETIETFLNKEDALKAVSSYHSEIQELSGASGIYFNIKEYYVEENEWENSTGVLEISKFEIRLVEKPGYDTLGVFDNYAAAEKAYNDYGGENEVYLSF